MEIITKTAQILRDEEAEIIIDDNGQITCSCDDGLTFKISVDLIDFNCHTLRCNVDGIDIDVALRSDGPSEIDPGNGQDTAAQSQDSAAPFAWTDASTRLLISLYKEKKDLVTSRKIKTHKLMWKQISEEMVKYNYSASPIQVENKFKTMERAFKKMVSVNNKSGRGRATCSFYSELTEVLANKHSIAPLAVSGRAGLIIRADASASENTQCVSQSTLQGPTTSTDTLAGDAPSTTPEISMVHERSRETSESSSIGSTSSNNGGQRRTTQMGSTAKSLMQCKNAIDNLIAEIKEQRTSREQVQLQVLEEQKKIVKLHEQLIEAAKEQRAFANQQREEKNKLLRQVIELLQTQKNEK